MFQSKRDLLIVAGGLLAFNAVLFVIFKAASTLVTNVAGC